MKTSYLLLGIGLLTILSCSVQKRTTGHISDEQFISFFADYLVVQQENSFGSLDSLHAKVRIDSLYQLHKLSPAEIDSARAAYNKDLAKWQSIYEKTIARMESLQQVSRKPIPAAHLP